MASQRIKGQEISVVIIQDSVPLDAITDIRSFEFSYELEQKDDGFLGETTNRKDSVFKGISGRMELHTSNKDVFKLIQSAVDKARRRTPGTHINIKASFNYPNGDRARVTIPDVEFGAFPINTSSRSDFVTVGVAFSASEARVIL